MLDCEAVCSTHRFESTEDAGFGGPAIPLDSLGVSDAIHSEDQRVETAASRKWEAIAAVFCGREERPFQSRLAAVADRAAPHEIEGE